MLVGVLGIANIKDGKNLETKLNHIWCERGRSLLHRAKGKENQEQSREAVAPSQNGHALGQNLGAPILENNAFSDGPTKHTRAALGPVLCTLSLVSEKDLLLVPINI